MLTQYKFPECKSTAQLSSLSQEEQMEPPTLTT